MGNRRLALKKTKVTDDSDSGRRVQWGVGGEGEKESPHPKIPFYFWRSIMGKRSGPM